MRANVPLLSCPVPWCEFNNPQVSKSIQGPSIRVRCGCGAQTRAYKTVAEAVSRWNTRTNVPAELIDALKNVAEVANRYRHPGHFTRDQACEELNIVLNTLTDVPGVVVNRHPFGIEVCGHTEPEKEPTSHDDGGEDHVVIGHIHVCCGCGFVVSDVRAHDCRPPSRPLVELRDKV